MYTKFVRINDFDFKLYNNLFIYQISKINYISKSVGYLFKCYNNFK